MNKVTIASSLLTLTAVLSAPTVLAIEPASVPVGAIDLIPTLGVESGYNDNLILQSVGGEIIGTQYTVLTPSLMARLANDSSEYTLGYELMRGIYDRSSIDNYTDWRVSASAAWMLNSRNMLELEGSFFDTHEARGTGFSQGDLGSLKESDKYEESDVAARYTLGNKESAGRLVFDLSRSEKEYTTDRQLTKYRDRDTDSVGATFFWKVGGRTDALLEATYDDIDYVNEAANPNDKHYKLSLDSKLTRVLAGVAWEATDKTEGSIKVGHAEKKFSNSGRKDFKGATWDVDVNWSPLSYSTVNLTANQEAREPNGEGSYIDARSWGANWLYGWNDKVSSNLYYNNTDETYKDDVSGRKDDIKGYGITFDYQLRRWVSVGLSFGYSERDSNIESFKYEQNLTSLSVQLSL